MIGLVVAVTVGVSAGAEPPVVGDRTGDAIGSAVGHDLVVGEGATVAGSGAEVKPGAGGDDTAANAGAVGSIGGIGAGVVVTSWPAAVQPAALRPNDTTTNR